MSNALFSKGREGILDRTIDMTGDVRVMLVKSAYVFDDTDVYLSDIGSVDNGRTAALANKSYTSGVFDADNISLITLAAAVCNAMIIFQHTGGDSTARLIAYIDSPSSGLPCTPGISQTINITWDNGVNKIFKL
jgi:hypothetical protein